MFIFLQSKPEVALTDPITHPLYSTTPSQLLPSNGFGDPSSQFNQNLMYPQSPPQIFQPSTNNVSQSFDQSGFNQAAYNQNTAHSSTQQNLQNVGGTERAETPQAVQKPPIPEEHIHMKTVLDELRNQCSYAANNPVSISSLNSFS